MAERKIDIDNINLVVGKWYPFVNDEFEGIHIEWDSDIGFGIYTIYRQRGTKEWMLDDEGMDYPDDKRFGEKLLSLILVDAHYVSSLERGDIPC